MSLCTQHHYACCENNTPCSTRLSRVRQTSLTITTSWCGQETISSPTKQNNQIAATTGKPSNLCLTHRTGKTTAQEMQRAVHSAPSNHSNSSSNSPAPAQKVICCCRSASWLAHSRCSANSPCQATIPAAVAPAAGTQHPSSKGHLLPQVCVLTGQLQQHATSPASHARRWSQQQHTLQLVPCSECHLLLQVCVLLGQFQQHGVVKELGHADVLTHALAATSLHTELTSQRGSGRWLKGAQNH